VDVSVFWPGGHLPAAFTSGFPAPGLSGNANAGELAASASAVVRTSTLFFMGTSKEMDYDTRSLPGLVTADKAPGSVHDWSSLMIDRQLTLLFQS
jgi:hypothetical protein